MLIDKRHVESESIQFLEWDADDLDFLAVDRASIDAMAYSTATGELTIWFTPDRKIEVPVPAEVARGIYDMWAKWTNGEEFVDDIGYTQ